MPWCHLCSIGYIGIFKKEQLWNTAEWLWPHEAKIPDSCHGYVSNSCCSVVDWAERFQSPSTKSQYFTPTVTSDQGYPHPTLPWVACQGLLLACFLPGSSTFLRVLQWSSATSYTNTHIVIWGGFNTSLVLQPILTLSWSVCVWRLHGEQHETHKSITTGYFELACMLYKYVV